MNSPPPLPFDDEQLADVLDGIAPPQLVAAVEADAAASARLAQLRRVQQLIAAPPAPAAPDRKAQSIAAALGAATPAKGVTSLATARAAKVSRWRVRRELPVRWLAAAAAAVVLAVGVPAVLDLGGEDDTTASMEATDDASFNQSLSEATTTAPAADSDEAGARASTGADGEATAEDAANDSGDDAELAAMADSDSTNAAPPPQSLEELLELPSIDQLLIEIDNGNVTPTFTIDDPLVLDLVSADCRAQFPPDGAVAFDLVRVNASDEDEQIVFVHFADDGSTSTLDAEDCAPVG